MSLLVTTVIALVVFLFAIGFDLGGSIGALLFLTVLLIGVSVRVMAPLIEWVRGPSSKL